MTAAVAVPITIRIIIVVIGTVRQSPARTVLHGRPARMARVRWIVAAVAAAVAAAVVVISSGIVVIGVGAAAAGNDVHGWRMVRLRLGLGAMITIEGRMIRMAVIVVVRHFPLSDFYRWKRRLRMDGGEMEEGGREKRRDRIKRRRQKGKSRGAADDVRVGTS